MPPREGWRHKGEWLSGRGDESKRVFIDGRGHHCDFEGDTWNVDVLLNMSDCCGADWSDNGFSDAYQEESFAMKGRKGIVVSNEPFERGGLK